MDDDSCGERRSSRGEETKKGIDEAILAVNHRPKSIFYYLEMDMIEIRIVQDNNFWKYFWNILDET